MKKNIKELLRIQDEPIVFLDDLKCHEVLVRDTISFMNLLKNFYEKWALNNDFIKLPLKSVYSVDNLKGDFRIMPCIISEKEKIKAVKIIGTNEENKLIKDKISVGKMLLIDWYDNYTYAALDACILSSFRTAAISVLAYSLYKLENNMSIIGLGRIGFYTALILHQYLGKNTIYCNDINEKNKQNFKALCEIYAPNLNIVFEDKIDELTKLSESIFLCTDSSNAILDVQNINNVRFISSIGADADNLSELDESIINKFSIITDSKQSMLLGDMKKWKEKKLINEEDIVEIKDLINKEKDERNIMFISTGVAVQDAIIAKYIYDKRA